MLELLSWERISDKDSTKAHCLSFTRECWHSFGWIIHSYGDSTGPSCADVDQDGLGKSLSAFERFLHALSPLRALLGWLR